jgi:hypothetical protein
LRCGHVACHIALLRPQSRPSAFQQIPSLFIFDATAPKLSVALRDIADNHNKGD